MVTQTGAIQDNLCSAQPIRIAGTTNYFNKLQDAYDAAPDGAVILARAVNFNEDNLSFSSNKAVTIKGGYDCSFTTQMENSELVGMITDTAGSVTIENFEIVIAGYPKYKVDEVRYRPFGETLLEAGQLSVNHQYTQQELDKETGLYNYNARLYYPALGRFISADSTVLDPARPQALNRYSYALNNPHLYTDSTGRSSFISHYLGTFVGALLEGRSFGEAFTDAKAVMTVDWEKDSQSRLNSPLHAMSSKHYSQESCRSGRIPLSLLRDETRRNKKNHAISEINGKRSNFLSYGRDA